MKRPSPNYIIAEAIGYCYIMAKKGKLTEAQALLLCKRQRPDCQRPIKCQQFDDFDAFAFVEKGAKTPRKVGLERLFWALTFGREARNSMDQLHIVGADASFLTYVNLAASEPLANNKAKKPRQVIFERTPNNANAWQWFDAMQRRVAKDWRAFHNVIYRGQRAIPIATALKKTPFRFVVGATRIHIFKGDERIAEHESAFEGRKAALAAAQAEGFLMDYTPFKHSK